MAPCTQRGISRHFSVASSLHVLPGAELPANGRVMSLLNVDPYFCQHVWRYIPQYIIYRSDGNKILNSHTPYNTSFTALTDLKLKTGFKIFYPFSNLKNVIKEPTCSAIRCKTQKQTVVYISVSQPPVRGPVPGPGINYTGPREA
jgi:hypothetical protein